MLSVLFALAGFLVGGLINILADELPRRERPQWPRCAHCGDAYPAVGWLALGRRLLLGGRCPACAAAERARPLLVELITPVFYAVLPLLISDPLTLLFSAVYVAILILVIVTDLEHRLILHAVTLPGTLFALLGSLLIHHNPWLGLLGALLGFLIFFCFFWIGQTLFGPGALGFGDVTLSTMMGAMLGFPHILFALVMGILLGGLFSFLLILSGRLSLRSYVAYGPYLAVAGIVMILWGEPLLQWYLG